jgi:hypothetical protein
MKRLLSLVCVSMLAIAASAQITWNVKAGGGAATMWGGDLNKPKPHFVAKLGVGIEKPLSSNLSLMPSLEVAWKGVKNSLEDIYYESTKIELDETADLLYIQIPILLAYRFNLNNNWNLTLKGGPYAAYSVYDHYTISASSEYGSAKEGSSNSLDIKKFDAGIDVGIDMEYHRFVFGVEGEMGFLSMFGSKSSVKNLAFYATIGYKF